MLQQVLLHGRLRNGDAELEELAVDARGAPERLWELKGAGSNPAAPTSDQLALEDFEARLLRAVEDYIVCEGEVGGVLADVDGAGRNRVETDRGRDLTWSPVVLEVRGGEVIAAVPAQVDGVAEIEDLGDFRRTERGIPDSRVSNQTIEWREPPQVHLPRGILHLPGSVYSYGRYGPQLAVNVESEYRPVPGHDEMVKNSGRRHGVVPGKMLEERPAHIVEADGERIRKPISDLE